MNNYYPSLEEVRKLARRGNLVPVYRDILADMETPVSAFLKIARGKYSFLLESVEGGEQLGRYSFIGTEPYLVVKNDGSEDSDGNPIGRIKAELDKHHWVEVEGLPRFHGGAVGFLNYETVRFFEQVPVLDAGPLVLPEAMFMFTDTILAFDHLKHKIKILTHARIDGAVEEAYDAAVKRIDKVVSRLEKPLPRGQRTKPVQSSGKPLAFRSNMSKEDFEARVERIKDYIKKGEAIQVVLSQRLSVPVTAHPFDIYRSLRTINPSPYMFYLHFDDVYLVGTSPELLVRVEDREISTNPIAGTRPRGRDALEDGALEDELRRDEKERAEHLMLVDLGRNDVGRVSQPGSVRVSRFMEVERYSHVMHLISHVEGKLREDLTPYDALAACFPAGTVTGAPKVRAMEIIAELEKERRGPYAGAVGYFGYSGNLDTAITIRTMVVSQGVAYIQTGAGIVAESVPEREYQETMNKALALVRAVESAQEIAGY